MQRLSPGIKKEIIHFLLTTATKRILDERKEHDIKLINNKSENPYYECLKKTI